MVRKSGCPDASSSACRRTISPLRGPMPESTTSTALSPRTIPTLGTSGTRPSGMTKTPSATSTGEFSITGAGGAAVSASAMARAAMLCNTRVAVDDRYERGLDAYASQFGIPREDVPQWFTDRYGEQFGTEAINAAGGAWGDDRLSLRDRSLVVVTALIAL